MSLRPLNAAAVDAMGDPVVRAVCRSRGAISVALGAEPEALGALHKPEIEKWWSIIKEIWIKAE